MIGDRGQLVFARPRFLIQRLNVVQHVAELDQRRPDLARGQRVEHVGVIGIRAVGADDFGGCGAHSLATNPNDSR